MKVFVLLAVSLFSASALAEAYRYIHAEYSYSTLGGVTTLTVKLRNNGSQTADCTVTVFNREKSTDVPAYGTAQVSFDSLPDGAQPRYGCTAR